MNKKILSIIIGIFAITLVSAISYYALFSASFTVLPAILIEGETTQSLGDFYNDNQEITIVGEPITITNEAPSVRDIVITDNAPYSVHVDYVGTLSLTQKDTITWEATGETIEITYTIVGDEFEVTGVPEGYTLIYYKDDNSNANDEDRLLTIGEIGLTDTNLPHANDWNVGELANYCDLANGYDDYNQCKGAKLWVVPTSDIVEDSLNWGNMGSYYYELDLIQYNSDGELVMSPESSLVLTPVYTIDPYTVGSFEVTTTVA